VVSQPLFAAPYLGSYDFHILTAVPVDPDNPLEAALRRLGASIEGRLLLNESGGAVSAT